MSSLSFIQWIIFGLIAWAIFSAFSKPGAADNSICPRCGIQGIPVRKTRGNFFIELALWLCFIIPGLIYSIWRLSTRYDACANCGNSGLVPVSSPAAQNIAANLEARVKCPYCAELILPEAKVCKHCGREVTPQPAAQNSDYICPKCQRLTTHGNGRCAYC